MKNSGKESIIELMCKIDKSFKPILTEDVDLPGNTATDGTFDKYLNDILNDFQKICGSALNEYIKAGNKKSEGSSLSLAEEIKYDFVKGISPDEVSKNIFNALNSNFLK